MKLFEEHLGKDTIGKIYQKLSKKNDAQAILDTSFTTRFLGSKYILQFVVVLLGLIVGLSIGMINYETDGNATIALATFTDIELSFQVIEQVQRSAFLLDELFTYYGTNLQDIYSPHDGIKYGHPIFNTNDFETIYQMVFNSTEILASSWNSLIYGNVNKLNARPIVGVYTAVDNIIQGPSNCSKYLSEYNLPLTYENYNFYCVGLETTMASYLTLVQTTCEQIRNQMLQLKETQTNNSYPPNPLDVNVLVMSEVDVLELSIPLKNKLITFIETFVADASNESITLTACVSVLGIVWIGLSGFLVWKMISINLGVLQSTRMLFNYVPIDLLEESDILRNHALYYSFPNAISDKLTFQTKKANVNKSQSNSKGAYGIISSHVDGTLVMNENGVIELFNSACHK